MTDALPLDLLVRGGTVVTDGAVRRADVGVRGGVVAGIWEDGGPQAAASGVDATGKIVMPGAIDAHFHTNTGWAQMAVKADDPTSATRSAAAGGVTTVITFVWGNAGQPLPEFLGAYFEMASQLSITDFSAHCGVRPEPALIEQIPEAIAMGVTSFKFHYAYRRTSQGRTTDDRDRLAAMRLIERHGGLALFHCENGEITDFLEDELGTAGKVGYEHYLASRPNLAEAETVHRTMLLCELTGCPVYIVHTSARESVAEIVAARARGLPVHAETCPQYLTLTNDAVLEWGPLAKVAPPLRTKADAEVLWQAVARGEVEVVGSDHSANRREDKDAARDDFRKAPFGTPIVELMVNLLYSEGVVAGRLSLERFVDAVTASPARLFGMYPRKGTLQVGADADILIWDPDASWTVRAAELVNPAGYSIFEGRNLRGRAWRSWLRGQPLLTEAGVVAAPGHGRPVARMPRPGLEGVQGAA
ncbi:MAG: amidohydrolase family protein [Chloroflexi bacterium]|nr:amidohydrolase family protein [Chloroflexota bacterium]